MNVDLAGHRLDLTISTFPYLGRVDSPQLEPCVAANGRSPEERSRNRTGQTARRCRSAFATCQNFGCKAASSHFPPTGDIHNNAAICQNGEPGSREAARQNRSNSQTAVSGLGRKNPERGRGHVNNCVPDCRNRFVEREFARSEKRRGDRPNVTPPCVCRKPVSPSAI